MTKIWTVVERDVRMFLQYKFMLIMRGIWFVAQISLFGLVVSRIVVVGNYFQYYAAGCAIIMLFSTSMFIGYDIYEEAEHGVVEYLLSLPVSRRELVLGRSIGGGLRSFVYVGPLLGVVLVLTGVTNPLNVIVAFLSLFLFAFGVSGLSITLAVGIKSHDKFDILLGVLDALIVRLSTTLYPKVAMMQASPVYSNLAQFNPLTFASDLFRWGAGLEGFFPDLTNPVVAIAGLILFFSIFVFISITIYERKLEGGGWQ